VKALRINRFLSQAGLGSRRGVEDLIREGRIRLNGEVVHELATRIDPTHDRVELDGKAVEAATSGRVFAFHKPLGVISSLARQGRAPCLLDVLPPALLDGRFFHLGRLDRDSSGLLLLSDDGELANSLMHPSHPVWKRYRIRLDRELSASAQRAFAEGGLSLDGRPTAPAKIGPAEGYACYRVELREGRTRQIRRMCAVLGREVLDLLREAIGPVELGDLAPGAAREVLGTELEKLENAARIPPH
jgi:pseudouridine synthase